MEKKKILIVEDEKKIVEIVVYNLLRAGYECDTAFDGEEGLMKAILNEYDLILLDIMLPKMNGFEVCERVRIKSNVPIIFVTAREEEKDKILGLDTGADDYVTKPYQIKELLSRINANIRRSSNEFTLKKAAHTSEIKIGTMVIDCERYSVTKDNEILNLSKNEYSLLVYLAENAGQAYTRQDLLEEVWGYGDFIGDIRNVDVTVNRLRQKIEKDPAKPEYLLTKRGVGYYMRKF